MKIRTLKKFLKVYKPIIEFKLPNDIGHAELHRFRSEVSRILDNKYLVFISQIPPFKINPPDVTKISLEQFKKDWEDYIKGGAPVILSDDEKIFFEEKSRDFITIHSPFKIPLSIYKNKLKQLNDLVTKLDHV